MLNSEEVSGAQCTRIASLIYDFAFVHWDRAVIVVVDSHKMNGCLF